MTDIPRIRWKSSLSIRARVPYAVYPAPHFSHDPSFDIVATCCAQHDDKMLDMMAQGEIEVSDQFYPVSSEFKHLHRGVPWVLDEELQIG